MLNILKRSITYRTIIHKNILQINININNIQSNIHNNNTVKYQYLHRNNRYYYRSQDKFIDYNKDYYQILGVSPQADYQQIKQKFYHLAKEYHPDHSKGQQSQNKFKQINEAYNVLSQPNLRTDYDQARQNNPWDQSNTDTGNSSRGQKLDYRPYSQMSKMQWAIRRQGYMKHNRQYNQEFDMIQGHKQKQQWDRAFRNMSVEQVQQELEFRKKLHKKYTEDVGKYRKMRDQYKEKRIRQFGDKIQRILGKTVRRFYDYLMKK